MLTRVRHALCELMIMTDTVRFDQHLIETRGVIAGPWLVNSVIAPTKSRTIYPDEVIEIWLPFVRHRCEKSKLIQLVRFVESLGYKHTCEINGLTEFDDETVHGYRPFPRPLFMDFISCEENIWGRESHRCSTINKTNVYVGARSRMHIIMLREGVKTSDVVDMFAIKAFQFWYNGSAIDQIDDTALRELESSKVTFTDAALTKHTPFDWLSTLRQVNRYALDPSSSEWEQAISSISSGFVQERWMAEMFIFDSYWNDANFHGKGPSLGFLSDILQFTFLFMGMTSSFRFVKLPNRRLGQNQTLTVRRNFGSLLDNWEYNDMRGVYINHRSFSSSQGNIVKYSEDFDVKILYVKVFALVADAQHEWDMCRLFEKSECTLKLMSDLKVEVANQWELDNRESGFQVGKKYGKLIYEYAGKSLSDCDEPCAFAFVDMFMDLRPVFQFLLDLQQARMVHMSLKVKMMHHDDETTQVRLTSFYHVLPAEAVYEFNCYKDWEYNVFSPPEFRNLSSRYFSCRYEKCSFFGFTDKYWRFMYLVPESVESEFNEMVKRSSITRRTQWAHLEATIRAFDSTGDSEGFGNNDGEEIVFKIDVYMLGLSILQMYLESLHYEETLPQDMSRYLFELIVQMTHFDPCSRMTASVALVEYDKFKTKLLESTQGSSHVEYQDTPSALFDRSLQPIASEFVPLTECFDYISFSMENIDTREDDGENIRIQDAIGKQCFMYTRKDLQKLSLDDDKLVFECSDNSGAVRANETVLYARLALFSNVLVPRIDLIDVLNGSNMIYKIYRTNKRLVRTVNLTALRGVDFISMAHCQDRSDQHVWRLLPVIQ